MMASRTPDESDDAVSPAEPARGTAASDEEATGLAEDRDDLQTDQPEGTESETEETDEEEQKIPLTLEVDIQARSTCERHVTVRVSREDINRYLDKEFRELMGTAQVPGFRPGRAPRRLIERRFRKEVAEKVKSSLLLDSIEQISKQHDLAAISEPKFDLEAVEIPEEGPMTYEFDLEVRPEFELPQWKGLLIERPVKEFTEQDVDAALRDLLSSYGQLVPHNGPAALGDYISTSLTFRYEGQELGSSPEELIRIRPVLSFRDGRIENFGKLMEGVRAGETRVGEAVLSDDAPNQALRGKRVTAEFGVKEVKRLQLPEMTREFLDSIGGFESEADLRDAVLDNLRRQLQYHQYRRAREQIAQALTVSANWDLPPDLLRRQSERELARAVLELRRSGFSEAKIRAYENDLRQHSLRATAKALKEHFVLERIAEEAGIVDLPEDYDYEIRLIAEQSGETPRRVRARLEKAGRMDVLRNQIIERKTIELILDHATFRDVPWEPEPLEAEALDRAASGTQPETTTPEPAQQG